MIKNLTLFILLFNTLQLLANDSIYVYRQMSYVDTTLQNNNGNKLSLQAYSGIPIDSLELAELLAAIPNKFNSDFDIVELIRVLFYSNHLYDNEILPVLSDIPFWLNEGDTIRNYWTENHMIMWMSSEWLLHERYGWPIDSRLRPRLIHYLETKLDYGFYEFFSSVYAPYTLSGLLNLYEFTEDTEIKQLSEQVAQRLLIDLLKPTTEKGVYFPASGRNYPEKYKTAYGQNHSSLIYLLTGMGQVPTKATHAGAFLATSNLPIADVVSSWTPFINTEVYVGHSLEESFSIHHSLSQTDQLIFQWSSSAYAHPDVIQNTFQVLADSNLWSHKDWDAIRPFSFTSPTNAPNLAEDLNVLTYSSIISGYNLKLFKNKSIALMSIADLWKGKIGFQQWPFAATVGTTAVYTQSGEVKSNWEDRDRNIENTHMPHVEQNANLALIMYRPEPLPEILSTFAGDLFSDQDVSLFWQENAYDEVLENGQWLIGRQDENYVAVRRSCTEMKDTYWACETTSGQTWAVLVGDISMYQSFSNFQSIVNEAEFTEDWYYDTETAQSVYHASIAVDTMTVNYTWGIDSGIVFARSSNPFSLFPNPSTDLLTINFNTILTSASKVKIINTLGEEIYHLEINTFPTSSINIETTNWPVGSYTVVLQNEKEYAHQKMTKI